MNNDGEIQPELTEAWRAFGSDTEAGRLLKKLYCGNAKPVINYPKLKTKKQAPSGPFIPGGGSGDDPRTAHLAASNTARAVKVPSLGNQSTHQIHAIDVLPIHRRPKEVIDKEMAQIKRSVEGFRPSVASYPGSQAEKQKLQQRFTYTQGSILPREMLPGADLLDKELSHLDAKRESGSRTTLQELKKLKAQVLQDIDARKQYVAEMAALGKNADNDQMQHDIAQLLGELKQINTLIQEHGK
ncbi:unnamed protein product [Aphanomyces euteiches]|uniref:Uncharacterized protein n=1 Tax=Aphanomyces euteiches TaxID=100861 RepID=A0A6G0XFA8_9STRA|nr:hypothetical protein Ae201684_005323 [Aphanomyces euteiches]KAH9053468.1 hypothetical protein Ae201684P_015235 [Aphanomyces euteiches]KAH9120160.1 hypothetical protein LEN26_011256 [Aphanomyces euteiches]KAH9125975.1 hypothetical protein AeMF1_003506 [Aphanomyces euteiches]KAH9144178.1 hypothetical protein AeRB84_011858 [Aphanomyces euteiches]